MAEHSEVRARKSGVFPDHETIRLQATEHPQPLLTLVSLSSILFAVGLLAYSYTAASPGDQVIILPVAAGFAVVSLFFAWLGRRVVFLTLEPDAVSRRRGRSTVRVPCSAIARVRLRRVKILTGWLDHIYIFYEQEHAPPSVQSPVTMPFPAQPVLLDDGTRVDVEDPDRQQRAVLSFCPFVPLDPPLRGEPEAAAMACEAIARRAGLEELNTPEAMAAKQRVWVRSEAQTADID